MILAAAALALHDAFFEQDLDHISDEDCDDDLQDVFEGRCVYLPMLMLRPRADL